jgi:hypothetical protein
MTEPRRISMCERRELVENVVVVLNEAQTVFSCPDVNMTMFPRLMTECCVCHMTREDVVLMDDIRRNMDRDIVETVREKDRSVIF